MCGFITDRKHCHVPDAGKSADAKKRPVVETGLNRVEENSKSASGNTMKPVNSSSGNSARNRFTAASLFAQCAGPLEKSWRQPCKQL
jgi:hypothetical protein